MKSAIFFIGFITVFTSCQKDPYPSAINNAKFTCEGIISDYYFEGEIDGDKFCYNADIDGYEMRFAMTSRVITYSPTLTVNDTTGFDNARVYADMSIRPPAGFNEYLKHYIMVNSPAFTPGTSMYYIIKKSIVLGELSLASDKVSWEDGFNIVLAIPNDGLSFFESRNGNQKDSYFRISELEIGETPLVDYYTVTFEFECNLYYFANPGKFYRRLENAKLRVAFSVVKE